MYYGKTSINALNLMKIALNRVEYHYNNRIAFSYLLNSDEEYKNRAPGEHDGISNLLRDVDVVDIAILIREVDDGLKLGFRSERDYDCRKIAEIFGGGGHKNASGATVYTKDLNKVKEEALREVVKVIEVYDNRK